MSSEIAESISTNKNDDSIADKKNNTINSSNNSDATKGYTLAPRSAVVTGSLYRRGGGFRASSNAKAPSSSTAPNTPI